MRFLVKKEKTVIFTLHDRTDAETLVSLSMKRAHLGLKSASGRDEGVRAGVDSLAGGAVTMSRSADLCVYIQGERAFLCMRWSICEF